MPKRLLYTILAFILCFVVVLLPKSAARAEEYEEENESDVSRTEVVIDAPPEIVYQYITDTEKISLWIYDDKLEVAYWNASTLQTESRISFTVKVPTRPTWDVQITCLEPAAQMNTEIIEGVFGGTLSFYLTPLGESKTQLAYEAVVQPQNSLIKFAWELIGRKIHDSKIETFLGRLKELAEEEHRAQNENQS